MKTRVTLALLFLILLIVGCLNNTGLNGINDSPSTATSLVDAGHTNSPSKACGMLHVATMPDHDGHTGHPDDPGKAVEHMAVLSLLLPENATHKAVKSGRWSSPSTWENGLIPNTDSDVNIPAGICVVYDQVSLVRHHYIRVDGGLTFSMTKNTSMIVDTLFTSPGSKFIMGTFDHPIPRNIKSEIIIADNGDIDKTEDPIEIGKGLVLHGTTFIHGFKKAPYLPDALTAVSGKKELLAGATQLKVKSLDVDGAKLTASTWDVGDKLVVMGTSTTDYEDEEVTITNISGSEITFTPALTYKHDTPSFDTTNASGISELNIYIGNLTRNIVIRSEYGGLEHVKRRGHVMMMHNPGSDVRYAGFIDLGRTDKRTDINESISGLTIEEAINNFPVESRGNPAGRYSLHFHRNGVEAGSKPFAAIGNAVAGSPGWGITHHDSYGAVNYNFVYDIVGAGIVSEDGNETGEWIGNFVTNVPGDPSIIGGFELVKGQSSGDNGRAGVAYETQSRILTQKKNIAANSRYGWAFVGIRYGLLHDTDRGGNDSENQPYRLNPKIVTVVPPTVSEVQYNPEPFRVLGNMDGSFVSFEENETVGIKYRGLVSWHRRPANESNTVLNDISGHIAWRSQQAFMFGNYRGGYHVRDSLFVDLDSVMRVEEKSSFNSFISSHFENLSSGIFSMRRSINDGGVYAYNTVSPGTTIVTGSGAIEEVRDSVNSMSITSNSLIDFDWPLPTLVNIPFPASSEPSLVLDSNYQIGPFSPTFTLSGTINDSVGAKRYAEDRWFFDNGADDIYGTADDNLVDIAFLGVEIKPELTEEKRYLGGAHEVYATERLRWADNLALYGCIKRNNVWVLPVPIWINDRVFGAPYPSLQDFEIINMTEVEILASDCELSSYPTIDLENESIGNPNVSEDGSYKDTRIYYSKPWKVKYFK